MARRRQGEPGVTVLLLCWVGGCDRVIVPASPPLGKGRGIYTINILTPDFQSTRPFWPTRTTRKSCILVRSGFVIIATPFYTVNKSSIAITSSSRREPSGSTKYYTSPISSRRHSIRHCYTLRLINRCLVIPYLPFRPRLARPFLRLFPHSVYNPSLHSVDSPLPLIRKAYLHHSILFRHEHYYKPHEHHSINMQIFVKVRPPHMITSPTFDR
jgi:hypothetical protein